MATAVEQLQHLESDLHSLRDSRTKLCSQAQDLIANYLGPNFQNAGVKHADSSISVAQLISELVELDKLQAIALHLKRLTDATRDVEKVIRSSTGAAQQDFDTYTSCILEGITAFGNAAAVQAEASALTTASSQDETVAELYLSLEGRLQVARTSLNEGITSQMQTLLGQCAWPPPLASGGSADAPSDPSTGGPPGGGEGGKPFPPSAQEALQKLKKLLVVLTALQLQEQKGAGQAQDPDEPGPILWFAIELAAPIAGRLAAQFSPSLPTGRLDKPEWLLNTALRLTREWAPQLEDLFKGAIEAAGLPHKCSLALEFPRAMREAVKKVLRTQRFPHLLSQPPHVQQQLWPLHVDALLQFEAKLAPLLGLAVKDPEELPTVALRGSSMELFCEGVEWLDAWAAAENAAQQPTVDAALYSEEGWLPASSLTAGEEEEVLAVWQREFCPTAGAESVMSLVEDCLARARYIPQAAAQRRFINSVAGDVLKVAEGRMLRILQQADMFRDPLGAHWAPKIASCICAAHYLQHHLTELSTSPLAVQLLVLSLPPDEPQESKEPATPSRPPLRPGLPPAAPGALALGRGGGGGGGAGGGAGDFSMSYGQYTPRAGRSSDTLSLSRVVTGAASVGRAYSVSSMGGRESISSPISSRGGATDFCGSPQGTEKSKTMFGPQQPAAAQAALFGRQAANFGNLRQKRSYRVAKLARAVFKERSKGYFRAKHVFGTLGVMEETPPPSPLLVSGLEQLRELLLRLSRVLDGKAFRETWRSVASTASRTLFNEIATEATFSPGGVQQFAADCEATMSLFAPFTTKPSAHFRELRDAVRLLQLSETETSTLLQRLQQGRSTEEHQQTLLEAGAANLTPTQAYYLLSHKVFGSGAGGAGVAGV